MLNVAGVNNNQGPQGCKMHTTSWAALSVGQNSEYSLVNEQI